MPRQTYPFLICLLSTVFALPANAATYTWTGATDSNWNTATNWGGTVPTTADTANINAGNSNGPTVSTTVPTAGTVNVGTNATGGILTILGGGMLNATNAYVAASSASSIGTMTVTGDGSFLNATGNIYAGTTGAGTLNILDGGDVVGASLVSMGNSSGSTGTILVSGVGSTLTSTATTTGTGMRVGGSGTGYLNIYNGGVVETSTATAGAYIGYGSGSTGTAVVDGIGSEWKLGTQSLRVGQSGTGNLTVQNGGKITSGGIAIGNTGTGIGYVTVTGDGSLINAGTSNITVGGNTGASGTLNVLLGGDIAAGNLYIGNASSTTGVATFNGLGSTVTINSAAHVGYSGSGTLYLQNQANLTTSNMYVGTNATGNGTMTVSGSGTSLTASGNIRVGESGTGILNISNGGAVTSLQTYAGYSAGSSGTINISGAGSAWTASGLLNIGRAGTGFLNITNGGTYISTAASGITVGQNSGAAGTITVDGTGSYLDNNNQAFVVGSSGTGTVNLLNGGKINNALRLDIGSASDGIGTVTVNGPGSEWNMANYLRVGTAGTGTMNILNGGIVKVTAASSSFISSIGHNTGSTGSMNVDGAGSSFIIDTTLSSNFRVGYAGNGTLSVTNGGTVSVYSMIVGNNVGSTGAITIDGIGSQVTSGGTFTLGSDGSGTVNITNGGTLNTSAVSTLIGSTVGSSGTITVDGAGSQWNTLGRITVGNRGSATMNITNGGKVYSSNDTSGNSRFLISGIVGNWYGSNGSVLINGNGSQWVNQGGLMIGGFALNAPEDGSPQSGTGTLVISNGGQASNTSAYLGGNTVGSTGTATITGTGSTWTNTGDIYLGNLGGTGNVQIKDGATVTTGSGVIYNHNDTERTSTSTVYVGWDAGSTGVLTIGGLAGSTAEASGALIANTILFGDGSATINFNHTDTNYQLASALVGYATINHYAGVTYLTGNVSNLNGSINLAGGELHMGGSLITNITGSGDLFLDTVEGGVTEVTSASSYTGTTTVNTDNTLKLNATIAGDINVLSNGRLQGNGTANNVTLASGATIAPGNSIGTLNVATFTNSPGSTYEVEVNADGQSDLINVSGLATLNGGTVVAIAYPDFIVNNPYTILTAAGGIVGSFAGSTENYAFIDSFLTQDANNVYLTLIVNRAVAGVAARTPNQQNVAAALTDTGLVDNSAVNSLFLANTFAELAENLDQVTGEIHASVASSLISDQRFLRDTVLRDDVLEGKKSVEDGAGRAWIHAFGGWSDTNGTFNTASIDNNTAGVLTGIEKQGNGYHAGIGVGASHTTIDQDSLGSQAQSNNYHALAYAGKNISDRNKVTVGTSYTFHDIRTSRNIQIEGYTSDSKADYHAQTGQVFGEISHDFAPSVVDEKAKAELYLQGAYLTHKDAGFHEDGEAGLSGNGDWTNIGTSTLGVRLHREIQTEEERYFTVLAGFAWQHAYGVESPEKDLRFNNTSSDFKVQGAPIDRDAALVNLGVGVYVQPDLSLNISYDGSFSQNTTHHGFTGRVNWKF